MIVNCVKSNFTVKRNVRTNSISKHYATKSTRITIEDVNRALQEAMNASNTHQDKRYVAAQWDAAHEVFVHYMRQEKYLAEHRNENDALDRYCELDHSNLECREYDV